MKNTIKMSLAAAVAVSAFSTSAFAGNLEEMIKGVSASGKINVEYQNNTEDTAGIENTRNQTEYDVDITFKVPVNEYITATLGLEADHDITISNSALPATDAEDTRSKDANGNTVNITQANFTYANGPVTAVVGKQTVATPFTYDQKGDGVVALYNAGPVTLAAAHFVNTNITLATDNAGLAQGGESINAVAAIGSVAGINLSAWYLTSTIAQGIDEVKAYTLNANGKIADMVSFDVRHSAAEVDAAQWDAEELTKVVLGVDVASVSFTAGYATTNDTFLDANGGRAHGVSFDDDDTTATGFNGEQLYVDTLNDADAFLLGVSTTFDKFAVGVTYIDGESNSNLIVNDQTDFSELILSASYAMSKNFTISSYYSMADVDYSTVGAKIDSEMDEFSLALTYKF